MIGSLPPRVEEVFGRVLACELSTLDSRGAPVTTPMASLWNSADRHFVLTTAISTPAKLERIRRDERVSMLFSDFTGSGLEEPPAVLVQGRAFVSDQVYGANGLEDFWLMLLSKKPDIRFAVSDDGIRRTTPEWFYWRARIRVVPERVWTVTGPVGEQLVELAA
jgi:hypothetical protein